MMQAALYIAIALILSTAISFLVANILTITLRVVARKKTKRKTTHTLSLRAKSAKGGEQATRALLTVNGGRR